MTHSWPGVAHGWLGAVLGSCHAWIVSPSVPEPCRGRALAAPAQGEGVCSGSVSCDWDALSSSPSLPTALSPSQVAQLGHPQLRGLGLTLSSLLLVSCTPSFPRARGQAKGSGVAALPSLFPAPVSLAGYF